MINDKGFDELFADFHPQMNDGKAFVESVSRKLEAIDMVKQYQQAQISKYRKRVILAFATGAVVGIFMMVMAAFLPSPMDLFVISVKSDMIRMLIENMKYVVMLICGFLLFYGIYGIIATHDDLKMLLDEKKNNITSPL